MSLRPSFAGLVERTACAVGVDLVDTDLGGLTPAEADIAEAAVRRGLRALPDSTRLGVDAAAVLVHGVLVVRGGGRFLGLPAARRRATVEVLRHRLPVVSEFVKLTRGLALVAVVDVRHGQGLLG